MRSGAALLGLLLALLAAAPALAISYTVQVVALSDQESALRVQQRLLDDGYPAYVVRASTVQGDVYRVRVGSFANRDAAVVFAETMDAVAGSSPIPALAEGIPAGVMPIQPRLLARVQSERFEILSWEPGVALREQPDETRPASYRVFIDGATLSFPAWRALPEGDGMLRSRNLPLWPPDWEDRTPQERESYRQERLEELAAQLGTTGAALESLQARPPYGPPYLVVLERLVRLTSDGLLIGVTAASSPSRYGPDVLALGEAMMPPPPAPLYSATPASRPETSEIASESWQVTSDDPFFRLLPADGSREWRSGVGEPLWSDGGHLLTRADEEYLLYDFVRR